MGLKQSIVRKLEVKLVRRPKDQAADNDKLATETSGSQTVATGAPGTNSATVYTNGTGGNVFLEQVSWGIVTNYSNDLIAYVRVRDDTDSVKHEFMGNPVNFPLSFVQPVKLPDGYDVTILVENRSASSVDYQQSVTVREDVE